MNIYKYDLVMADVQTVRMPKGAKILSAQVQKRFPFLWAAVDPNEETENRTIRMVGTGHEIRDFNNSVFIDTIQLHDGNFVFHIFEEVKE